MDRLGLFFFNRPAWLVMAVIIGLLALPVAIWQDLKTLSDKNLERQASTMNAIINDVRGYYAMNVASRVATHDGNSVTTHNYMMEPGAIPIPATLSLELGEAIDSDSANVTYRFVSDLAFTGRPPHNLSDFEQDALNTFRNNAGQQNEIIASTGGLLNRSVSLATPVVMAGACVACHNAHPESPKKDWEVGDVRAVQSITVEQPLTLNVISFQWVVIYLIAAGSFSLAFLFAQFRAAGKFQTLSRELAANNDFLADVSTKISRYLSPQVYRSIFAGDREVSVSTERKKLTVFFSDIKDFTTSTEQLQPEELTQLLNDYFTEMSKIAEGHGATIDKFIGDAMVAFFGDPDSKGAREDARACVRMALEMQQRLRELERVWRAKGLDKPFKARMGINTGYCNVGNFGSETRMDYTIIGAEANLAARLESIAEPGGITMSFETFAHVKDFVDAEPGEPVHLKGIAREVVPYHVRGAALHTYTTDFDTQLEDDGRLVVDLSQFDERARAQVQKALRAAIRDLDS